MFTAALFIIDKNQTHSDGAFCSAIKLAELSFGHLPLKSPNQHTDDAPWPSRGLDLPEAPRLESNLSSLCSFFTSFAFLLKYSSVHVYDLYFPKPKPGHNRTLSELVEILG